MTPAAIGCRRGRRIFVLFSEKVVLGQEKRKKGKKGGTTIESIKSVSIFGGKKIHKITKLWHHRIIEERREIPTLFLSQS